MIFHPMGRDMLQKEEWKKNSARLLELFRNDSKWLAPKAISRRIGLSQPTVRKHVRALEQVGVLEVDDRERPMKCRLTADFPAPSGYVSKMREVLKHVPDVLPPDAIESKVKLSAKTEATVKWTGREFSRQYRVILNDAVGMVDKALPPSRDH